MAAPPLPPRDYLDQGSDSPESSTLQNLSVPTDHVSESGERRESLGLVEKYIKLHPELDISLKSANQFQSTSNPMSLSTFLQAYKPPALVRIKEDHQCPLGTLSLKQHQILVILSSIPSLNIVTGTKDGQIFKLAAYDNQALFSPSTPHAKQLYTYKDLLSAPEQPCLVSPLSDFRDKKNRLIEKGTPLLVKWSHSHFKRSTPKLRTLDKEAVYIPSDIPVQFSSRPQDTCLVLNDLLEHFQLPLDAYFLQSSSDGMIQKVELHREDKEDAVVGLLRFDTVIDPVFYIPSSLPVKLETIKTEEDSAMKDIYATAKYDYVKIQTLRRRFRALKEDSKSECKQCHYPDDKVLAPGYSSITIHIYPHNTRQRALEYLSKETDPMVQKNKEHLMSLTTDDVQELLRNTYLESCSQQFKESLIDGQRLLLLNFQDFLHLGCTELGAEILQKIQSGTLSVADFKDFNLHP